MSRKQSHRQRLPDDGLVSIQDFADAKKITNKPKKGFRNRALNRSENNFDDVDTDIPVVRRRPILERSCKKVYIDPNHVYNDYIEDIWFLIAEHIRPEDVGSFALICTKTQSVIASGRFWKSLYKRFYRTDIEIPEEFKPDSMARLKKLRANVICSLFYMYPPFIERTKIMPELKNLQDQRFASCSYEIKNKIWIYCFKFSNGVRTRKPRIVPSIEDDEENMRLDQIIAAFNNIYDNPDEGLSSLVVYSSRFIPIPTAIMSWEICLRSIRKLLCCDMRSVNLEIKLVHDRDSNVSATIVFPSIIEYKLFNWWDPGFRKFQ